jgi:DNA-directed RNA polymerase subunit alpha
MIDPTFTIKAQKETADYGKFIIEPLEQGYGYTLGNALRRVLLTSLPGAAVTQVKIAGVRHQFSTLEGLKEDIVELILNIKQIRLKYKGEKPVKIKLDVKGPGEVKAGDLETPAGVKIVNPEHLLGKLADKKSRLKVEMVVQSGFGYLPAEEGKGSVLGIIPIDASFTPIRRVNYKVEATRVGRRTDLDRLILELVTDKTIAPSEALKEAAKILISFFSQIVEPKIPPAEEEKKEEFTSEILRLTVEELNLPTRIANVLRKGGYETVKDLTLAVPADIVKVKNLGEKSIKVIQAALAEKGVSLKGE